MAKTLEEKLTAAQEQEAILLADIKQQKELAASGKVRSSYAASVMNELAHKLLQVQKKIGKIRGEMNNRPTSY